MYKDNKSLRKRFSTLKILFYNIYAGSDLYIRNGQLTRVQHLFASYISEIKKCEIIVFSEVFHHQVRDFLLSELKSWYPYVREIPRKRMAAVSGGIMIFSRHTIVDSDIQYFHDSAGADSLSSKGFLWVQIRKNKNVINIIGTHTQAWDVHGGVRKKQFQQMESWLKPRFHRQHCIVLGDLNWDFYSQRQNIIAEQFPIVKSTIKYSGDNDLNDLMGMDGAAEEKKCAQTYYNTKHCICCEKSLVDYAYVPLGFPRLRHFTLHVRPWQNRLPIKFRVWKIGWITTREIATRNFSDHFPIIIQCSY